MAASNVIATEPPEVIAIEAAVEVALTEDAEASPIVAPQAPAVLAGRTYGNYTNCTTTELNQVKAKYGEHLPYQFFTTDTKETSQDMTIYCIAYIDDISLCQIKPKFQTLLTFTDTMKALSDYGKALGGDGKVVLTLPDFGDYNGKRVCVVYTWAPWIK